MAVKKRIEDEIEAGPDKLKKKLLANVDRVVNIEEEKRKANAKTEESRKADFEGKSKFLNELFKKGAKDQEKAFENMEKIERQKYAGRVETFEKDEEIAAAELKKKHAVKRTW